jgi:dipeptidyl aminopeptidase/acylaminoacyl peptidase
MKPKQQGGFMPFPIPFLFLLVSLLLPIPVEAASPDIDSFARHNEFDEVKISPDGRFLAAGVNDKEGRRSIVIIRLKDRKITARSSFSKKIRPGHFFWVNPERIIIELDRNLGAFDSPVPTGNLFAVNFDGSQRATIFGRDANALKSEPSYAIATLLDLIRDEPRKILIQTNRYDKARHLDSLTTAYKLDVYNGRLNKVAISPLGSGDLLADHRQQIRAAIGNPRDSMLTSRVFFRDSPQDEWRMLSEFDLFAPTLKPLKFTPDNQRLYVESNGDTDTTGVFLLDPGSGKLEKISQRDDSDLVEALYDENDQLVGAWYEPDKPAYDIIGKSRFARQMRGFIKAFKGQRVLPTSRTWDGRHTLLKVSSDTNAGDYYLYDGDTRKLDYLLSARSWEKPEQLRPVQPITLSARDGLELHGYLTLPKGNAPFPMVVMPHGGPHGPRDYWAYDPDVQLLANAGYAVLQVNFRGSGGYGSQFMEAGFGEWGRKMQQDVTDATRWAIEQGHADPRRICIYGGSYGGYSTLMGVATEPELYRCAIGYAGVYDLNMMYRKGDIQWTRRGISYLDRVLGTDPDERARRSPVNLADRIKAPVLLIHGGKDLRVPIDHARAMEQALKKAGNPPETLYKKKEGHGFFKEANRREVYRRMLDFLEKHIGAGA